jgi:hypothetical protein
MKVHAVSPHEGALSPLTDLNLPVISLLWVNMDDQPATSWANAYVQTGMDSVRLQNRFWLDALRAHMRARDQISYAPPSSPMASTDWPTLQDMISSGKRSIMSPMT